MNKNNQSPKILTSPIKGGKNIPPKNQTPPDPMEAIYKALGVLSRDCETTRNHAAISVAKCYAANSALVEILIEKGLLDATMQEVYLLKALRNFHESSKKDIEEGLAELESGKSVAPENIVAGMKEELAYHTEILSQVDLSYASVAEGKKTYHEFIKELSDYLNAKYDLKK